MAVISHGNVTVAVSQEEYVAEWSIEQENILRVMHGVFNRHAKLSGPSAAAQAEGLFREILQVMMLKKDKLLSTATPPSSNSDVTDTRHYG